MEKQIQNDTVERPTNLPPATAGAPADANPTAATTKRARQRSLPAAPLRTGQGAAQSTATLPWFRASADTPLRPGTNPLAENATCANCAKRYPLLRKYALRSRSSLANLTPRNFGKF